ncbi:hypothetical protein HAX54_025885, partial [Datura stramonium]|nr:hypothetical protein [Datura stramonium]
AGKKVVGCRQLGRQGLLRACCSGGTRLLRWAVHSTGYAARRKARIASFAAASRDLAPRPGARAW